ncbi:MAG: putative glycine betaine transport system integral rane protein, partial [Nocardioides sp.]|nr:putative glycine betaine transport system integral rane protein [Nocardioides sp.]
MTTLATTRRLTGRPTVLTALRAHGRLWSLLFVVVVWIAIWAVAQGHQTLELSTSTRTGVHGWFQARSDWVEQAASSGNNVFVNLANSFADAMNSVFTYLQHLFTVPEFPRPLPQIGWLGTVAIASWLT